MKWPCGEQRGRGGVSNHTPLTFFFENLILGALIGVPASNCLATGPQIQANKCLQLATYTYKYILKVWGQYNNLSVYTGLFLFTDEYIHMHGNLERCVLGCSTQVFCVRVRVY